MLNAQKPFHKWEVEMQVIAKWPPVKFDKRCK